MGQKALNKVLAPASQVRQIRFRGDRTEVAYIEIQGAEGSQKIHNDFVASAVGLILNESYSGCCLVVGADFPLQEGDTCRVVVGKLSPMVAQVRWKNSLDRDLVKIGLRYQE